MATRATEPADIIEKLTPTLVFLDEIDCHSMSDDINALVDVVLKQQLEMLALQQVMFNLMREKNNAITPR